MFLNNRGLGLSDRYTRSGWLKDLDAAIKAWEQALAVTPADSPARTMLLNNLGSGLRTRYDRVGRPEDLVEAARVYEMACQIGLDQALEFTLHAALHWGNWALERKAWLETVKAYGYGHQAIDRLFRTQVGRAAKESWLRDAQDLPANSAYALAQLGRKREAVIAIEQSRTRLLAEVLEQNRRSLEHLPELGYTNAYERYRQAAERIDLLQKQAGQPSRDLPGQPTARWHFLTLRQELDTVRTELEQAIEAIRQVPGYEDFFQAPTFEQIQEVATAEVPLVFLLTTPSGSLAIIVQQTGAPSTLPLDRFTSASLNDLLYDRDEATRYLHGSVLGSMTALEAVLDEVLSILREHLMGPLAVHLHGLGYRQAALIPVGVLALLPLHAAVLDWLSLCYLPSAQALHRTVRHEGPAAGPPHLLGIGNPTSREQASLVFARQEMAEIAALFDSKGWQKTVFYEGSAVRSDVTKALAGATHLHFSCHGRFDLASPLDSALYLTGDETLTLRDLLGGDMDVSAIRLAVLSACQTGITDFQNVPDEAVGFPAGFIQAGVPGVVSTLWPVNDLSTALLMVEFYRLHLEEEQQPARALRGAQLWLRDATAKKLKLADTYEQLYRASGRRDRDAFQWMRYYGANPDVKPFAHPYYWAGFVFSGV
jgi:hypothetical protein